MRIDGYLLFMDFTKSETDPNMYYILVGDYPLILILYVDDLFLTGVEKLLEMCKRDLIENFEMKNINIMHYFLGLEV